METLSPEMSVVVAFGAVFILVAIVMTVRRLTDAESQPLAATMVSAPTVIRNVQISFTSYRKGRAVVIDSETTGFSPRAGDRMVSFAAIELQDGIPTGQQQSFVFNPMRKCPAAARRVHGLTDKYLSIQEPFSARAPQIADFVDGSVIVGHNVSFDLGFLESELALCRLRLSRNPTKCTMEMFKAAYPMERKSLDNACARLGIDASLRAVHHGALIDAALCMAVFQLLTDPSFPNCTYSRLASFAPPSNEAVPKLGRPRKKRPQPGGA